MERKLKDPVMAGITAEIHAAQHEPAIKNVVHYLMLRLQEAREDNDTALEKEVYLNQGKIQAITDLLGVIAKGNLSA